MIKFKNGVWMSIGIGEGYRSTPENSGLAPEDYEQVEIMLWFNDMSGYSTEITPQDLGLHTLAKYWKGGVVGAYVPFSEIHRLKRAILNRSSNDIRRVVYNRRKTQGYLDWV